jgi:hypothetical protein
MSTPNATHALAAFVRLLLHARAGGQAKVDALLALSQRTLHVPRKVDGSDGFATLVNENGDWALPVFTSQEQLDAAADVFGWRRQDRTVLAEEVGARRAVHYALNEGAAFMVIDAVAPHALEATREELKPLVSTQNRSDTFGPYAGVGRISSSILEATRPDAERQSSPAIPAPRITRQPVEPATTPPKLSARVTRASFAPPRDDGGPAQRRPTVSFARSSRPPPSVEVQLGRSSWAPDGPLELDLPQPPPVARSSQRPRPGQDSSAMDLNAGLGTLDVLDLGAPPPSQVSIRPLDELPGLDDFHVDTERPRMSSRPAAALLDLDDPLGPDTEIPAAGAHAASVPPQPALPEAPATPPPPAEEPIEIRALNGPADDALLAALTEVLRDYPEVEWATFSLAARGAGSAKPAVGLRVLDSFRQNVDVILAHTTATAHDHGAVSLQVLLLDDADLMRSARQLGEVFYPWRRKTRV